MSISLSWKEPPDNNAPILRYNVSLEVVDDGRGNAPLVFTADPNTTELSLDDLTPFTVYSVQVVAVNSIGSSAPSVPMTVMTAEGSECVCLHVCTFILSLYIKCVCVYICTYVAFAY